MAISIERIRDGEKFQEISYEGCVLTTRERNYYDDSDFYALVWDEESGSIKTVEYATTRAWTYNNGASTDVTPENAEKAWAWLRDVLIDRFIREDEEEAKAAQKDKRVTVVEGKHKGKSGIVFWKQERRSRYGTWSCGWRLGIRLSDEKDGKLWRDTVWVDAGKVVVEEWEQYTMDREEIERRVDGCKYSWVLAVDAPRGMVVV